MTGPQYSASRRESLGAQHPGHMGNGRQRFLGTQGRCANLVAGKKGFVELVAQHTMDECRCFLGIVLQHFLGQESRQHGRHTEGRRDDDDKTDRGEAAAEIEGLRSRFCGDFTAAFHGQPSRGGE